MPVRVTASQYARLAPDAPKSRAKGKKKAPKLQSEAALLKQVLGWLKAKNIFAWRANSGSGLRPGKGGRMVPVASNPAGTPDVLAIIPTATMAHSAGDGTGGRVGWRTVGALYAIECKAKGGKLRPSQVAWQARAERAGVVYLEIRSLQELIEAMKDLGIQ